MNGNDNNNDNSNINNNDNEHISRVPFYLRLASCAKQVQIQKKKLHIRHSDQHVSKQSFENWPVLRGRGVCTQKILTLVFNE